MPLSHHPPHIYLDDTWYFITSSTYQRRHLFHQEGYKDLLRDQMKALAQEFKLQLAAWVILDNHYHILAKSKVGAELSLFFGRLHGRTSFDINGRDNARHRQVWHNYWDTLIRDETGYWTRFNYIHYNSVKHGYAERAEEWKFSSYHFYLERKGEAWLADSLRQYPIIDFTNTRDDF